MVRDNGTSLLSPPNFLVLFLEKSPSCSGLVSSFNEFCCSNLMLIQTRSLDVKHLFFNSPRILKAEIHGEKIMQWRPRFGMEDPPRLGTKD